MKAIPHYTKILTLGSAYTENALIGDVIIQEKVDGSQFRFGINEEGKFIVASKNVILDWDTPQKMFKPAMEHLLNVRKYVKKEFSKDTYFFAETLQKQKHNVLNYERVPKNHIVLFDALMQSKWLGRTVLKDIADFFEIDLIPELWRGNLREYILNKQGRGYSRSIDFLKRLIETTPSYLGNEMIEGVVIKNYEQTILLGGHVFPLFTKYVREQFKERHDKEWKTKNSKNVVQEYVESFKSEVRWEKAIQHLKERGELEGSPRDIGKLFKEVSKDIVEEERENIGRFLYGTFIKEILRHSTKGLAEWYKEKLLKKVK